MKPSRITKLISARAATASKRPIMIWGAPGAGKSAVVKAAALALGIGFIDLRLPLMDQSGADFRFPMVDVKTGTMRWITSSELPTKGKGILFIDEIVQGTASQMAAASQLILDRRIGTYELPEGWIVVAAGNRETHRAATNKMPSHIANRFTHIEYEVDATDWYEWAESAGVNPMVIAFLMFKPEFLHRFDAKQRVNPTCRTWEYVSDDLNAECVADIDMLEVFTGTVGAAAAGEFVGFCRVFRDLPDYDEIVSSPKTARVPTGAEVKYAISSMLARRAQHDDMKAILQYVERLPSEFQILCTQEITRRNKRLAESSAYINWTARNKDLLVNSTVH